jgi:hypothetical protein
MRIFIEVLTALLFGAIVLAVIGLDSNTPKQISELKFAQRTLGELRCEDRGAIVIKVDGRDYAVNGMASPHYPPIQALWNESSHPEIDIDRLIAQGITLCAW